MQDRTVQLKVKIKTLAYEAKAIRREEQKARPRVNLKPLGKEASPEEIATYRERERELKAKARKHCDHTLMFRLRGHRTGLLREEARHSLLAYGFLNGLPYDRIEKKFRKGNAPDFEQVQKMAFRFGPERMIPDYRDPFPYDMESKQEFDDRVDAFKVKWETWRNRAGAWIDNGFQPYRDEGESQTLDLTDEVPVRDNVEISAR